MKITCCSILAAITVIIIIILYFNNKESFSSKEEKAAQIMDWLNKNNRRTFNKFKKSLNNVDTIDFDSALKAKNKDHLIDLLS